MLELAAGQLLSDDVLYRHVLSNAWRAHISVQEQYGGGCPMFGSLDMFG